MEAPDEDDNYRGKIECRDGILKVFFRPKGKTEGMWLRLSNFTMSPRYHSINKIPGRSEFTIFHAQVQNGEEFFAPYTMSDLDNSQKAFAVIEKLKEPFGGQLDMDRIGPGATKAKLHDFLIRSIENYQRSANKMAAIVTVSTGFLTLELEDQTLEGYCIGPQVVLPTSKGDSAVLKLLPKIQLPYAVGGPKNFENFIHPESIAQSEEKRLEQGEFIKCLQKYHGQNAASPIATLIYVWLMNRKKDLEKHRIKMGVLNVVGKVATGKSTLRANLEAIFPKQPSGLDKIEKTLSVHKLFTKVTEERWSLVQDPPANLKSPAEIQKMNFFCDNYYENKIEETGASRNINGEQPAMGLILIWPNEDANLFKANMTAITKGLYLVHERNFADFAQLEREWQEKSKCAPGIFHTLLAKPDMERLKTSVDEILAAYHEILREKGYTEEILNITNRLLEQYATIQAGCIQWTENTNFDISIDELQKYFVEKCIPYVLHVIKGKQCDESGAKTMLRYPPEEQLIEKLRNMSEKEFLCHIGIYQELGEPHFGFSLDLVNMSKGVEALVKSISTSKGLKAALSRESTQLWFKRKTAGCHYGKFRRVQMYVCPVSAIPDALRDTIKEKLLSLMPNTEELDMYGNVKADMDHAFGEIYGTEDQAIRSVKHKLIDLVSKLSEKDAEKAYRFAENLVRKRQNLSTGTISSGLSESEVEESTSKRGKHEGGEEQHTKQFASSSESNEDSDDGPSANDDVKKGASASAKMSALASKKKHLISSSSDDNDEEENEEAAMKEKGSKVKPPPIKKSKTATVTGSKSKMKPAFSESDKEKETEEEENNTSGKNAQQKDSTALVVGNASPENKEDEAVETPAGDSQVRTVVDTSEINVASGSKSRSASEMNKNESGETRVGAKGVTKAKDKSEGTSGRQRITRSRTAKKGKQDKSDN